MEVTARTITLPRSSATDFFGGSGDFTTAVREAQATVEKYSHSFSRPVPQGVHGLEGGEAAVLITGTTGALGAHLLTLLLANNDVSTVYALNRPHSRHTLRSRQRTVLRDQGLDPSVLSSAKLVLLECDTAKSNLDLPDSAYDELRRNVTHIIINAWPVKFVAPLADFEPSIKGARHLVDLALSSTARVPPLVQFISSIAVSRNARIAPGIPAAEEPILDAEQVVGLGYAEAKWVVERMLQIASTQTGLRTLSVRVGQLCGAKSGSWDTGSWVPVVVRSAADLGCLPDSSHESRWVRVADAAAVLFELLSAPHPPAVLHLVNPHRTSWREVCCPYAEALGVPLVSFAEWMRRIALRRDVVAARLLPFWRLLGSRGFDDTERFEDIDIRKACSLSPALRAMRPIDRQDIESWFDYWMRIGALTASKARL